MSLRAALFALALLVATAGCSNAAEPEGAAPEAPAAPATSKASARLIDVDALKAELPTANVVVDVRTPAEFASGHVPGAINIPLQDLGARSGELSEFKDGEVHLICQSGGRSARAAKLLGGEGYSTVDVKGGTGAWVGKGYATE